MARLIRTSIACLVYGLTIVCFILLSSCSTVQKDGPPSSNIDVSHIKDAEPKVEPLSKYGNKPTYQVFGKQYHVMDSSKDYVERGMASWYGTKFHARKTSSGEPYDMLAMTAAHRSLPLPTYVEVTNLKNGKKVVVKVNDRGPFEKNRIIDLSYAAAKKLGMAGHGVAQVEVRAIDPRRSDMMVLAKDTQAPSVIKSTQRKPVYLQVGAFQNKSYADRLQQKLKGMISSPVQVRELAKAKKYYRVQIGPIRDAEMVARINKQLKSIGLDGREMVV